MVIGFVSDEMFVAIADAQLEFMKKTDGTQLEFLQICSHINFGYFQKL
jgi:hypothetical protein